MAAYYVLADTVIDSDDWAEDVSEQLVDTDLRLLFDTERGKYVIVEEQ